MDDRLEELRDKLRQAAVHSPSSRTRWAAAAALEQTSDLALLRLTQSMSCSYAPGLKKAVEQYWRTADA